MVKPQNFFTRDMIYDMHKELTVRIPNVNTPATTYAFDDMAVECRNFEDVRMFFSAFTTPSRTTNSTISTLSSIGGRGNFGTGAILGQVGQKMDMR